MAFISSLLRYETIKYATIQDPRLGLTRWILLALITIYVILIEILQQGGFLSAEQVVGVVRFSLQQPTTENCDPAQPNCTNAFASLDTLHYCQQSQRGRDYKGGDEYHGNVRQCQIYEAVNAQVVRETSIVVWTRGTAYNQSLVCGDGISGSQNDMTCPRTYRNIGNMTPSPFYVAQSDAFTVLMEHSVTASQICASNNNRHSYACSAQAESYPDSGRLRSISSQLCLTEFSRNNSYANSQSSRLQPTAPCFIGPNRTAKDQEFFSLNVLLQAAGENIDDCINSIGGKNDNDVETSRCETLRESGGTVLLQVVWNDFQPFRGRVRPFYYYSPAIIGRNYKESLPYYQKYRAERVLLRAHGIKIATVVTGNFHQFDMLTLLVTLTTALGLFAVTTTIVDSLMLYVLPEKESYQQVKYEQVMPSFNNREEVQTLDETGDALQSRLLGDETS